MFDEEGTYQCFYQSYLPGTNRAELEDVADVVVVAKVRDGVPILQNLSSPQGTA